MDVRPCGEAHGFQAKNDGGEPMTLMCNTIWGSPWHPGVRPWEQPTTSLYVCMYDLCGIYVAFIANMICVYVDCVRVMLYRIP